MKTYFRCTQCFAETDDDVEGCMNSLSRLSGAAIADIVSHWLCVPCLEIEEAKLDAA